MIIIGDIHGKIDSYYEILSKYKSPSIQVGDFGFSKQHRWHLDNLDSSIHKINFGNHDDYTYLNKPHSLGNFNYYKNVFTIRGAESIDKHLRTENLDWWREEELSYSQMQECIDFYEKIKPEIVVSHDCPDDVRKALFNIKDKSITSTGLQFMFEIHQPKLWIFGHHHKSKNEVINGTKFICLDELEVYDTRKIS